MKIAIIQLADMHSEILGCFLQLILETVNPKKLKILFFIPNYQDVRSFFYYYLSKLDPFDFEIKHQKDIYDHTIDKYLWLTAREMKHFTSKYIEDRSIVVAHYPPDIYPNIKTIVLTPLLSNETHLQVNSDIHYILPTMIEEDYRNITKEKGKVVISLIGVSNYNYSQKEIWWLNYFQNMGCTTVNIFTMPGPSFETFGRFNYYVNLETKQMISKINESHLIITLFKDDSWYHQDRMSGSIPLSYNCVVPLLTDSRTKETYNIQNCFVANNRDDFINEILKVRDMNYEEYKNVCDKLYEESVSIKDENLKRFGNIIPPESLE